MFNLHKLSIEKTLSVCVIFNKRVFFFIKNRIKYIFSSIKSRAFVYPKKMTNFKFNHSKIFI
jgi:hypothetical protein